MALNLNSSLGLPPPHIKAFLYHAARHSPYYREQDWAKNLLAGLPIRMEDIPLTRKPEVAVHPERFYAENIPANTSIIKTHTSGTTGLPIHIWKCQQHYDVNLVENMRLLQPWNLASHQLVVVNLIPKGGKPSGTVDVIRRPNGKVVHRLYSNSIDQLAGVVLNLRPSHVHSRPSMLEPMLKEFGDFSFLRLIETSFEPIPKILKDLIAQIDGCRNLDAYGSVESAMMATTCRHCGVHHLARATNTVEVLKEDGTAAGEGEIGRVIVTVHTNPVMPLIRYDTGDHVRATYASPCEPGRLSILEIMGRERTLFKTASGRFLWPDILPGSMSALGVRRLKLYQTAPDCIEVHYDPIAKDATIAQPVLQDLIDKEVAPGFRVVPVKTSHFPLAASGKYLKHERLF